MPLSVWASASTRDLWKRTLLVASHDRQSTSGDSLLHRMLVAERRRLGQRHGPGWLAEVESKYHRPKPARTTTAPPTPVQTDVD